MRMGLVVACPAWRRAPGAWMDVMISESFSNLNNPMILYSK